MFDEMPVEVQWRPETKVWASIWERSGGEWKSEVSALMIGGLENLGLGFFGGRFWMVDGCM